MLTHEFPPKRGGAGAYCEELSRAAADAGREVKVLAPAYAQTESAGSREVLPVPSLAGSQSWRCSLAMVRATRRNRELVAGALLHLAEPGALRAFLRFGLGPLKPARLLVTLHGSELLRFTHFPLERFLFRRLLRKADAIHLLSRHNREALLARFPELEPKVVLCPGAPARNVLPRTEADEPEPDAELVPSPLRILTVGRLHPRKGQDRLLRALAALPAKLKAGAETYFIGPESKPDYHRALRRQAEEAGLHARFLGDLSPDELRDAYAASHLFALTSVPHPDSVEGFGFVYLEAAAHGLPALGHDVGGVADAVVHEQTGLLVPPDNPTALAQALETLLADHDLRNRLGQAARERAAGFTWNRVAQATYGKQTTKQKRRPRRFPKVA